MDESLDDLMRLARWSVRDLYLPGAEIEDLHQEALIGLVVALRTYDSTKGGLPTFVVLCARRAGITAVKTANRHRHQLLTTATRVGYGDRSDELVDVVELVASLDPSPEERLMLQEEFDGLKQRMLTLTDKERTAVLGLANGLSYAEIEGVPGAGKVKWVDNALQRGRKKLAPV